MSEQVRAVQARWRGQDEELGWLAELRLQSAPVAGDHLEFVFRDAYGQQFGWRWPLVGEPLDDLTRQTVMAADLEGNLLAGGFTAPDDNDVRWLVEGLRP